jgi:hypothetical protein
VVSVFATGTKGRVFKPAEAIDFKDDTFLRLGSKAGETMS